MRHALCRLLAAGTLLLGFTGACSKAKSAGGTNLPTGQLHISTQTHVSTAATDNTQPGDICATFTLTPYAPGSGGSLVQAGAPVTFSTSSSSSSTDQILGCVAGSAEYNFPNQSGGTSAANWGYLVSATDFVYCDPTVQQSSPLDPSTVDPAAAFYAPITCMAGQDEDLVIDYPVSLSSADQGGYIDISAGVDATTQYTGCKMAEVSGGTLYFGESNTIDGNSAGPLGLLGFNGSPSSDPFLQQFGGQVYGPDPTSPSATMSDTYYTGQFTASSSLALPSTVFQTFLTDAAEANPFSASAASCAEWVDTRHAVCETTVSGTSANTVGALADAFFYIPGSGYAAASVTGPSTLTLYSQLAANSGSDYASLGGSIATSNALSPNSGFASSASSISAQAGFNDQLLTQTVSPPAATPALAFTGVYIDPANLGKLLVTLTDGSTNLWASLSADASGNWSVGTTADLSTAPAGVGQQAAGCLDIPSDVTVAVSPANATLGTGGVQQFLATVTGSSNHAVTWSITDASGNPITDGSGTLDASGNYTAPSGAVLNNQFFVVIATSVADPAVSGPAKLEVDPIGVTITNAPSGNLNEGDSFPFAGIASAGGTPVDPSVTWSASCNSGGGSIDPNSGDFIASSVGGDECTITATSVQDSTASASATVGVSTPAILITNSSSGLITLVAGAVFPFAAVVTGADDPSVTWSATCGAIDPSGNYTVPAAGPCTVTATSNQYGWLSASVQVMVAPFAPPGSLGGTVTGLLGSGLVLSSAGEPDLAVPAGVTTFIFANLLASGASYGVTVSAQPANPAQVCTVARGSGTTNGAAVTGVAVSCYSTWKQIAAGAHYTVGIKADGSLWTWGDNSWGQLGDGTDGNESVSPEQIGSDHTWSSVTAGFGHTVAIKADGSLWAWGNNSSGQLGDGTGNESDLPEQIGTDTTWSSVAAGDYFTVAIKADGSLWAWGDNSSGELGDGTMNNESAPEFIAAGFASVAAGGSHTVAIKADGSLWAWGDDSAGQLGDGDGTYTSLLVPQRIGTDSTWSAVATGDLHAIAIQSSGALWAWGDNTYGELGDGTTNSSLVPEQIAASGFASISASGLHSAAVKTDGSLWAWGDNTYGQLGDGTTTNSNAPENVGTGFAWVAAGYAHTVAAKTDGTLWVWGQNYENQLGDGNLWATSPLEVGTGFASVAAGNADYDHTVAIKTDGTLWAWGGNVSGDLGAGTTSEWNSPESIGAGFASAAVSGGFTVAVMSNGTLWAWGDNSSGQLGDGTNNPSSVPEQIGTDDHWSSVAAGGAYSVAIKTDGSLWAWGDNSFGDLGLGTTTETKAPAQVGSDKNWLAVAAGGSHTVAVKTDGTLWAWGDDISGDLGDGSFSRKTSPEQIGVDDHWSSVVAGEIHTLALKTDGTLWAWGDNSSGQLGDGTSIAHSSVPEQIGQGGGWSSVAAGYSHSVALRADGTLWAWGDNEVGELGDGTFNQSNSPEYIAAGFASVAAGYYRTVAVQADGALWAWGDDSYGELGDGRGNIQPVPAPVP